MWSVSALSVPLASWVPHVVALEGSRTLKRQGLLAGDALQAHQPDSINVLPVEPSLSEVVVLKG